MRLMQNGSLTCLARISRKLTTRLQRLTFHAIVKEKTCPLESHPPNFQIKRQVNAQALSSLRRAPANFQRKIFEPNSNHVVVSHHFDDGFGVFPSVGSRRQRQRPHPARLRETVSRCLSEFEAKSAALPEDRGALQKGVETARPPSTESQAPLSDFFRPDISMVQQMVIAGMDFTCLVNSLSKYELPGKECFLSLLAKALGYAIVAASTIVKLPQVREES